MRINLHGAVLFVFGVEGMAWLVAFTNSFLSVSYSSLASNRLAIDVCIIAGAIVAIIAITAIIAGGLPKFRKFF